MPDSPAKTEEPAPGVVDAILRAFADVRPQEGLQVLLLLANVFVLLVAYYILKTVREPLILATGGAELKTYAAAAQAATLMVYVPLYGWVASRLPRRKLILAVLLFFALCVEVFFVGGQMMVPGLGFVFFVWVGIFSLTTIAQFWSYANEIYRQEEGERLFPIIAVGSTSGAWVGSAVAAWLFARGTSPYAMMQVAAILILVHLGLYAVIQRRSVRRAGARPVETALERGGGFALVFRNPYLLLVAALLVLLNVVNTTGEYVLGRWVVTVADARLAADPGFDKTGFIGSFYGSYFMWVNVATTLTQAFLVSRLVKYLGMRGVLLALPVVAFGSYGLVALGAGFLAVRWAKTAENATDYSIMNTARQMIWLPTTREEKYKAKQALDTFFVRAGDMLSAGVVFAGTQWLSLSIRGFAGFNLVLVVVWLVLGWAIVRRYERLTAVVPDAA